MQYRVLIVDDDKDFFERVSNNLREDEVQAYWVNSGNLVLEQAKILHPHLILLEVEIPDIDGIELCQIIRETPELSQTIVAFLTKQTDDYVQVAAFKAGCDDFIFKAIKPKVLTYRIMALLKRQADQNKILANSNFLSSNDDFYIDTEKFLVVVDSKTIYLPKKQFLLLQFLASQPSKVFTRNSIFEFIWGHNSKIGVRTIDVYIRKIREQIGSRYIKTIKGVGYRFE
jgi:two-component system alkaline phosphatase synthesis response regulator PhoP